MRFDFHDRDNKSRHRINELDALSALCQTRSLLVPKFRLLTVIPIRSHAVEIAAVDRLETSVTMISHGGISQTRMVTLNTSVYCHNILRTIKIGLSGVKEN